MIGLFLHHVIEQITRFHKFDKSLNNDYLLLYCKLNFT